MPYMLLIVEPVGQRATRNEAQGREAYAQMQQFGEALAAEGKLQAVESLASTTGAVRVSRAPGQPALRDGPFAEAKEMIGGFFLSTSIGNKLAGMLSGLWEGFEDKKHFFLMNFALAMAAAIMLFLLLKWLNQVMREKNID